MGFRLNGFIDVPFKLNLASHAGAANWSSGFPKPSITRPKSSEPTATFCDTSKRIALSPMAIAKVLSCGTISMLSSSILTTSPVTDAPASFSIEQREPTIQGKLLTFTM